MDQVGGRDEAVFLLLLLTAVHILFSQSKFILVMREVIATIRRGMEKSSSFNRLNESERSACWNDMFHRKTHWYIPSQTLNDEQQEYKYKTSPSKIDAHQRAPQAAPRLSLYLLSYEGSSVMGIGKVLATEDQPRSRYS